MLRTKNAAYHLSSVPREFSCDKIFQSRSWSLFKIVNLWIQNSFLNFCIKSHFRRCSIELFELFWYEQSSSMKFHEIEQVIFQLTVVTHFLDLSLVYGSSDQVAANLRAGDGGRLNVDIRQNRQWPPAAANKSQACDVTNANEVCYQTGKFWRNHSYYDRFTKNMIVEK